MSESSSFRLGIEKEVVARSPSTSSHLDLSPSSTLPLPPPTVGVVRESPTSYLLPPNHPLPSLPMELKREILRFCDPATLASTSQVSLAFFQLSCPLLYRDMVVKGYGSLNTLFHTYTSPIPHPHLNAYLDLGQFSSFTFLVSEEDPEDADAEFRPKGRLFSSGDLFSVETFNVQVTPRSPTWPCPHLPIFQLFDPIVATITGTSPLMAPNLSFAYVDVDELNWTRLSSITFVNAGLSENLRFTTFAEHKITVTHDITNRWPYLRFGHLVDSIGNALDDVYGTSGGEEVVDEGDSLLCCPSLDKLVFRVRCKEQSEYICGVIRVHWRDFEVELQKQERWSRLIEVEEMDLGKKRSMIEVG